jgi:hypothetical protein
MATWVSKHMALAQDQPMLGGDLSSKTCVQFGVAQINGFRIKSTIGSKYYFVYEVQVYGYCKEVIQ